MPGSATATLLQQAAEGLTYPSETDAPWKAFAWPDAAGEPSLTEVRKRGKHRADSPAEEQTVADLFQTLIEEKDWYGEAEKADLARNRSLLESIRQHLRDAKVFRVGERKIAIYVIGQALEGGWAGLRTTAVET
jgi:hypothetical protein